MMKRRLQLGLTAALWIVATAYAAAIAATGDADPAEFAGNRGSIDPDAVKVPPAKPHAAYGNPLWAVPLATLSVTRERPIFVPSRRAPPPVAVAAPSPAPLPQPAKSPEAERLQLALVGTVVSPAEGIGIFLDQPTRQMIRLKSGEEHGGWILRSVRAREVTFEKGTRVEILSLPRPDATTAPPPIFPPLPKPDEQL